MSELANCPFCGQPGGTQDGNYGYVIWMGCKNPACSMSPSSQFHTKAEAITAWNRRAPAEPSAGWRGIESAPKDGTLIDVWVEGGRWANVFWQPSYNAWARDEWRKPRHRVTVAFTNLSPTHWMPLPSPPLSEEGDGSAVAQSTDAPSQASGDLGAAEVGRGEP